MKTEERDSFLTQVIGGYYSLSEDTPEQDFSTWEGFGKLWLWAQRQKWWKRFCNERYYAESCHGRLEDIDGVFYVTEIDPSIFANALYKFLKEN